MKSILKQRLAERFPEAIPNLQEIFFISAEKGHGVAKVAEYLSNIRGESLKSGNTRFIRHFYVIGYQNSGKSTFINKLNHFSRNFSRKLHAGKRDKTDF